MADRKYNETEHAWVEERLSAYIDNQLAALERAQLERHLRDCARCQTSHASLKWTVALVKQAPAPALPRAFTLPVPAQARRAPAFGFGFARLATVAATLLLCAVIGVDAVSQFGGGFAASAPAPAALQNAARPTSIALAPSQGADETHRATPTPAIGALVAPPAAQPPAPSTETLGLGAGPGATPEPGTAKSAAGTPPRAPVVAPRGSITATSALRAAGVATPTASPAATATATATVPAPTATARPSPTANAQAFVLPTVVPLPPRVEETPQQVVTPLRFAEIGLLFLAAFFGALTALLRKRN